MKKLTSLSLFVAASAFLFSCGAKPDAAAKSFYNAMAKKDYEGAKQFATKGSHTALDGMKVAGLFGAVLGGSSTAAAPEAKEVTCDAVQEEKTNCTVCCDAKGQSERFSMVKEDGKWVVSYSLSNAVHDVVPH